MNNKLVYAPRDIFEQILKYAVIPTFDLIIVCRSQGVVLVRRKIAPYKNTWALPGLRMMKPEGISDTLARIALQEVGVEIESDTRRFIGQYVGRFRTEQGRQDLSTCYAVNCEARKIQINTEHFSGYRFVQGMIEVPENIGAMYLYFLEEYFAGE
jgi:ADP-ribose pyrophosphatase YjhB (NUDIX family)